MPQHNLSLMRRQANFFVRTICILKLFSFYSKTRATPVASMPKRSMSNVRCWGDFTTHVLHSCTTKSTPENQVQNQDRMIGGFFLAYFNRHSQHMEKMRVSTVDYCISNMFVHKTIATKQTRIENMPTLGSAWIIMISSRSKKPRPRLACQSQNDATKMGVHGLAAWLSTKTWAEEQDPSQESFDAVAVSWGPQLNLFAQKIWTTAMAGFTDVLHFRFYIFLGGMLRWALYRSHHWATMVPRRQGVMPFGMMDLPTSIPNPTKNKQSYIGGSLHLWILFSSGYKNKEKHKTQQHATAMWSCCKPTPIVFQEFARVDLRPCETMSCWDSIPCIVGACRAGIAGARIIAVHGKTCGDVAKKTK